MSDRADLARCTVVRESRESRTSAFGPQNLQRLEEYFISTGTNTCDGRLDRHIWNYADSVKSGPARIRYAFDRVGVPPPARQTSEFRCAVRTCCGGAYKNRSTGRLQGDDSGLALTLIALVDQHRKRLRVATGSVTPIGNPPRNRDIQGTARRAVPHEDLEDARAGNINGCVQEAVYEHPAQIAGERRPTHHPRVENQAIRLTKALEERTEVRFTRDAVEGDVPDIA